MTSYEKRALRFSATVLPFEFLSLLMAEYLGDEASIQKAGVLQRLVDLLGCGFLDRRQRQAHEILDLAKSRERIFRAGNAWLDEDRLMQRHQPILQIEGA